MSNHALNPADAGVPLHAASMPRRWLRSFDRGLIALVEVCAAALLMMEIVVMFAGVVCRYVLHQPLVWSDELAGILFLWLAMLGAVLALRRGEHMRMTALVSRLSPQRRAFVDTPRRTWRRVARAPLISKAPLTASSIPSTRSAARPVRASASTSACRRTRARRN